MGRIPHGRSRRVQTRDIPHGFLRGLSPQAHLRRRELARGMHCQAVWEAPVSNPAPADLLELTRERNVPLPGMIETACDTNGKIVFWHRELPPREAEAVGEHTIEATSGRVAGTLRHRDDLWDRCYLDLMDRARARLEQEIARLGGHYARVVSEDIEPRHDDNTGEAWMYGRFDYELYRRRPGSSAR